MKIPEVIRRLEADPRVPGFQTLTFHTGGRVTVNHRYGAVRFENCEQFGDWLVGLEKTEKEGNPS